MIIDLNGIYIGSVWWNDESSYMISDCYGYRVEYRFLSGKPLIHHSYITDHDGVLEDQYPSDLYQVLKTIDFRKHIKVYYRGNPDYIYVLISEEFMHFFIQYPGNKEISLDFDSGHLRGIHEVEKIINDLPKYSEKYSIETDLEFRYQ